MEEAKAYLAQHDLPMVVENMTNMLITEKPADPISAMASWLHKQRPSAGAAPFKLYMFPVSVNCLQIELLMKDAGVPVEVVHVNGEQKQPEYTAKFPRGRVPSLEHGQVCLEESSAILRYVCNAAGLMEYYPPDPVLRFKVDYGLDFRQVRAPLSEERTPCHWGPIPCAGAARKAPAAPSREGGRARGGGRCGGRGPECAFQLWSEAGPWAAPSQWTNTLRPPPIPCGVPVEHVHRWNGGTALCTLGQGRGLSFAERNGVTRSMPPLPTQEKSMSMKIPTREPT